MKNRIYTVGAIALSVASGASAEFLGWSAHVYQCGDYYVMNVYAAANSDTDAVLNVFNLNVQTNAVGGFHQSAENPFWSPNATQDMTLSEDSWITLGTKEDGTAHEGTVADSNVTNFDDSYGASDFSHLNYNGSGAGWGVGNPYELVNVAKVLTVGHQGVQAGYGVLVGHFVIAASAANANTTLTFGGGAIYNEGSVGSDDQTFSFFIPGPGAVALLAVGGLVASRRRRA